jgi:hypothetical protein
MSGRRGLQRGPIAGLAAVAVLAWAGCGDRGTGAAPRQPVDVAPAAPDAPLLPGALPEGFHVDRVALGDTSDTTGDRALVIGPPDRRAGPGSGPLIVVGDSSGSASIAGPGSADGEPVPDLGVPDSFDAYIADDGPWTWVVFNDDPGCIEDCLDYVVGRGVPDEDLIALARGTDYEDAGPVVDPGALPGGMVPLVAASPSDGVITSRGTRIGLGSQDAAGRIAIQQVDAPADLASLWGFWIDDAEGTPIRGGQGWAGQVGAVYEEADVGRVWVEDGRVVAVLGWGVDEVVLDDVVDGLRPGTPDDLAALGDEVVTRVPTPEEMGCGSAVLSAPIEGGRWAVGLGAGGGGDPDALETCTDVITPAGGSGGTFGTSTLAPVGSLTVGVMHVGGGPIDGTFVYGAAPPGTATVELTGAGGAAHPLQLSDTGPRDQGERWYATFEPALPGGETVIARAADGSELARAPAGG